MILFQENTRADGRAEGRSCHEFYFINLVWRIEEDIRQLKKEINILERIKKGQIGARKEGEAKLI